MSEIEEFRSDGRSANDHLHNFGLKRRVAYIASLECIQKCDCLPKTKGRVVYLELELDLLMFIICIIASVRYLCMVIFIL